MDDTLRAKKTFGGLGYYKTPSYGLTKYPDEPLFKGIESFQKDHGLRKDGVMKPGGETANKLGKALGQQKSAQNMLGTLRPWQVQKINRLQARINELQEKIKRLREEINREADPNRRNVKLLSIGQLVGEIRKLEEEIKAVPYQERA